MSDMFNGASSFAQDLPDWNVANVQTMARMFKSASAFDGNLSAWQTSSVTDMMNMFQVRYYIYSVLATS
jgi:surface protein